MNAIKHITICALYEAQTEHLALKWIAGKQAGKHQVLANTGGKIKKKSEAGATPLSQKSMVGYLNLIHPHQIQIIGSTEIKYLKSLHDISLQDAMEQLFVQQTPACIIITDNCKTPTFLKRYSNQYSIPLFSSTYPSTKLTDNLHYYLNNLFAETQTIHGVFMEIMGIGVLIMGASGIGKSELALALIAKGHRLIADDAPQFSRIAPDIINGTCPGMLQDFLEVRGIGIINVKKLYGNNAITKNKYLSLIIQLTEDNELSEFDRLTGSYTKYKILDVDIPKITLPIRLERNMDALLECAARNHILHISGYNAVDVLNSRKKNIADELNSKNKA